ncbi:hypothetical protein F7725_026831, partial [Dissostichus mawsoni]
MKPPLSDKRKRDITDKIADFVALDMRPVNIVEGEGFKQMMKFIEPGYTVPKRDTVMHAIKNKYNTTKQVLLEKLKACTAVSFTTDTWTSNQMDGYMTVTEHFISQEWQLHSFVLETKVLEVSHTAANIAERLGEVMEEFGIPPEKRVAVVHDNAANMVPMITLTELLSQDVNASATLPMLVNMKRRHLLSRDDDCTTVKAVKKKITEEIDKRWELTGSLEGSIYIQAAVLDPRFKSLSFLDAEKRDDAYATVSDLAESLSPAEEATAQREDSSGAEESEPAPKRQREKQQDISMLMAFDEDQEMEHHKKEMKTYLDRTKVYKGPLI